VFLFPFPEEVVESSLRHDALGSVCCGFVLIEIGWKREKVTFLIF